MEKEMNKTLISWRMVDHGNIPDDIRERVFSMGEKEKDEWLSVYEGYIKHGISFVSTCNLPYLAQLRTAILLSRGERLKNPTIPQRKIFIDSVIKANNRDFHDVMREYPRLVSKEQIPVKEWQEMHYREGV